MSLAQILLLVSLCAVALGWVARRFDFPYPIALVIGGGVLGSCRWRRSCRSTPSRSWCWCCRRSCTRRRCSPPGATSRPTCAPIGLLAIGLVIATTLAVGAALKFLMPDIPWAAAFVFGAIVSPPDAVAATAILSRLNIPRRVVTVLEGESLVNDASGLVLYKFAVAAVLTGTFSLLDASVQFAGGVARRHRASASLTGLLFVVDAPPPRRHLHRGADDAARCPTSPTCSPNRCTSRACWRWSRPGMVRGRYSPEIVSAEMRILARSMWNMLVFLLNSLVFMLIGMQLSGSRRAPDGLLGGAS